MATNTTLKKSKNIVSRTIGEETVLLPIAKSTKDMNCIYTLNKPAARVWELIDGKNSIDAIKAKVSKEFEVSDTELNKRMAELLSDLKQIKAVI